MQLQWLYRWAIQTKIGEIYRDVLKNFSKQIPIFMIHNKLDSALAALQKQDFNDPLSLDVFNDKELSQRICRRRIGSNEGAKRRPSAAQVKAKKRLPVQSCVHYLKR